jgi:hypothetical protein
VTSIDQVKRKATLLGDDGKKFTVQVGREAVNFDQVRVGDLVIATLTQKVVVSLDDKAASSGEGEAAVVARAPKGGQPGGLAAETIQVIGTVIAIDLEKRKTTLQFEVRVDVPDLALFRKETITRTKSCLFPPDQLPPGSYQFSCESCEVQGTTLSCQCRRIDDELVNAMRFEPQEGRDLLVMRHGCHALLPGCGWSGDASRQLLRETWIP